MKITELNISEFGGIKDLRITPSDSFNIISGENESGKSTVLLFIKFMLYGLGRKSSSNIERERSISWSGHTAAGSMAFSHCGRTYRIERRYVDGGRESKTVCCLDDGSEIRTDKTPGEYFLGVPKEVFESSSCIGQMRSADINAEKMSESIRNMLTSADENVDVTRVIKSLDAIRVTYRHKNKSGGSLYDGEQRIKEQRHRLDAARDDSLRIDSLTQKLETVKNEINTVTRELDSADALLTQINKISILRRFEKLRCDIAELRNLKRLKKELCEDSLKTDFFPDSRYVAQLRLTAEATSEAKEYLEEKRRNDNEKLPEYDAELADIGERLEQAGGVESVKRTLENKIKCSKKCVTVVMIAWVIGAILALGGAIILALGSFFGATLFSFLPVAVIITAIEVKRKKKFDAEINEFAEGYSTTVDNFSECLAASAKALALRREGAARIARLEAEISEAQKTFDRYKSNLRELLERVSPNLEPDCDVAISECERIETFLSEYERLTKDEESLTRFVASEEASLKNYDEQKLREEMTVNMEEITRVPISEAERRKKFLVCQKTVLEQKLNTLNGDLIRLKAIAEDPLPIADELSELEEKQTHDIEFYSALTLAMEAIEQAGQTMSGSVIPAISAHAGEIMSRISKAKYSTLRANGSLDVSLDSEGFGVKSELLSGGTRDVAYLSLRIALFMRIYGDTLPPLIMDEALCQLDDARAERMIVLLDTLVREGVQILLFTSHDREKNICERNSINFEHISLTTAK